MIFKSIRDFLQPLRATPIHPQWLLGKRRDIAGWLGPAENLRLLDIGCADRWVERQIPPQCMYIGLDYPVTGQALYGAQPNLFADASRLPVSGGVIDAVVLLEVLEHLRHPREALEEIARVLRPGGRLLLTVPFLYPIHDAPHDYQRYTVHGLEREIEAAGLRVEKIAPNLSAAESAGLIANLALGGMATEALNRRSAALILLPLIALAIPVVNLVAWLFGRLLPSWPALTAGYTVTVTKP